MILGEEEKHCCTLLLIVYLIKYIYVNLWYVYLPETHLCPLRVIFLPHVEAAVVPSPDRWGSADGRHPALPARTPRDAPLQWRECDPGVPGQWKHRPGGCLWLRPTDLNDTQTPNTWVIFISIAMDVYMMMPFLFLQIKCSLKTFGIHLFFQVWTFKMAVILKMLRFWNEQSP